MNPVGVGSAQLYSPQTVRSQATANNDAKSESAPLKVEQNKVTLSEEGKALLAALKEIEEGKKPQYSR